VREPQGPQKRPTSKMNATTTIDNGSTPAAAENFADPPRGPVDAIRTCLVKFCDFRGRASRSEFWWFFAATLPVMLLYSEHLIHLLYKVNLPVSLWAATYMLAHVAIRLPLWAAAARRLHDTGRTGWWILPDVTNALAVVAATGYMYYFYEGEFPGVGGSPFDEWLAVFWPAREAAAYWWFVLAGTAYYLFTEGGRIVVLCLCLIKGNPQQNRFDRGTLPKSSLNQPPV